MSLGSDTILQLRKRPRLSDDLRSWKDYTDIVHELLNVFCLGVSSEFNPSIQMVSFLSSILQQGKRGAPSLLKLCKGDGHPLNHG